MKAMKTLKGEAEGSRGTKRKELVALCEEDGNR